MKNKLVKRFLYALPVLALMLCAFVLPNLVGNADAQATHNYVVDPGSDATMRVRVKKSDQQSSSTVAYAPAQFLIVSDTPDFVFGTKGHYLFGGSGIKYEAYQLLDFRDGLPGKRHIGRKAAQNDFSTWNSYNQGDFTAVAESVGIDSSDSGKFRDANLARYVNKYVFLIKIIYTPGAVGSEPDYGDQFRGFADHWFVLNDDGCPTAFPSGTGVPNNRTNGCISILSNEPNVNVEYEYLIRSTKQITSAPSNIAFAISWAANNSKVDYENNSHGSTPAGNPYTGVKFINSTPSQCRPTGWGINNVDWDSGYYYTNFQAPTGTSVNKPGDGNQDQYPTIWNDGPSANPSHIPPHDTDGDQQIGATLRNATTGASSSAAVSDISGNWRDSLWTIPVGGIFGGAESDQRLAELRIRNWNDANILYLGGAEFTSGALPSCRDNGFKLIKIRDDNQDGDTNDINEGRMAGITFTFEKPDGNTFTRTTDVNGEINEPSLAQNGRYKVTENVPAGFLPNQNNPSYLWVGNGISTWTLSNRATSPCVGTYATEGDTQARIITPRWDVRDGIDCSRYNGQDAVSNQSLIFQSQFDSDRRFLKWRMYHDTDTNPFHSSGGYEARAPNAWDGAGNVTGYTSSFPSIRKDYGVGPHSYTACAAANRWSVEPIPVYRWKDDDTAPFEEGDAYYYSTGGGTGKYTQGGNEAFRVFPSIPSGYDPSTFRLIKRYSRGVAGVGTLYQLAHGSTAPAGFTFDGNIGYVFDNPGPGRKDLTEGTNSFDVNDDQPEPSSPDGPFFMYTDGSLFNGYGGGTVIGHSPGEGPPSGEPQTWDATARLFTSATDGWACTRHWYWVNQGPNSTATAPPDNTQYNYNCPINPLTVNVNDPDVYRNNEVDSRITVSWGGRTIQAFADPKPNGFNFTSDDMKYIDTDYNGSYETTNTTLTNYLHDQVPAGTTVSWRGTSFDTVATSDIHNAFLQLVASAHFLDDPAQPDTGFRWGPDTAFMHFYKRTTPQLAANNTTKRYFNAENGTEFDPTKGVVDGQTIRVLVTVKNGGETPAKSYSVTDHFGSPRDFEQPSNFKVNGTPVNPSVSNTGSEWVSTFGSNGGGMIPPGDLDPNETFTYEYITRANRNQGREVPFVTDDSNRYVEMWPNNTDFGNVTIDYCGTNSQPQLQEHVPKKVFAPYVRAGRGDVHSNARINTFAGQGVNATYIVTASGTINGFTAGIPTISGYSAATTTCVAGGQIDWRKEMARNITLLMSRPRTTATNGFTDDLFNPGGAGKRGVLNPSGSPNVWVHNGNLSIDSAVSFQGVGTIVVNGDLNINADMTYSSDTSQLHSLGIIVLGNLNIAPAVRSVVGSYYVSDMATTNGVPTYASNGCPNINPLVGNVVTATGSDAVKKDIGLDVQGLMVARSFALNRYYDTAVNDPNNIAPAENFYYDGRILAATPPGFSAFRNQTVWYEVAP